MRLRVTEIWSTTAILAAMLFVACRVTLAASAEANADANSTAAQNAESKNKLTSVVDVYAEVKLTDVNPHWDKARCGACHQSEAQKGSPNLRADDDKALCLRCHTEDVTHKYIHPAGIEIPSSFQKRIKKKWKGKLRLDSQNKLTCITCHDLLNQCLPGRSYMADLNPRFLREGPYSKRTDICYKCHDSSKYKMLVAHDQIEPNGTLKLSKCRLCHIVKSKGPIKSGIKRDLSKYPLINDLNTDRINLCIRCHKKIDHPTNKIQLYSLNTYRHFVPITEEKKKTLDEMKVKTGMLMPLEPDTGRIYCGTCHEPHQPGVFEGEAKTSMQGTIHRLRVKQICAYCHDK